MHSRSRSGYLKSKTAGFNYFNIPVECMRKTRSLNLDRRSCSLSWEVYKILKSNNGRKIFT